MAKKEWGQAISDWSKALRGILVIDNSEGFNLQAASVVYILCLDPFPSEDEQVGVVCGD